MKVLFFFVHPSKYYLFRYAIRKLKEEGHQVEIAIVAKDMLADLLDHEGWEYTNLIPEGRRSRTLPPLIATAYYSLKTLWKLFTLTFRKKYDLFVSDDLLIVLGKLKKVPTLFFTDDDLDVVGEVYPLFSCATKIVSPQCTRVGKFESKKIGYRGYHELAYLHPDYFTPDFEKTKQFNPDGGRYFLVRLVSLTATHDQGKQGIGNEKIRELIELLKQHGHVYITSERQLPPEFEPYRIKIKPQDITHALYYAHMFIGDSQTMTSEAALVGTPALRCNDFVGRIGSMEEKENKFQITFGFKPKDFDLLLDKARELLQLPNVKEEWRNRVRELLTQCEDVNKVILREIYASNISHRS